MENEKLVLANGIANLLKTKALTRDLNVEGQFKDIYGVWYQFTQNHDACLKAIQVAQGGIMLDVDEFDEKYQTEIMRAHRYALVGLEKVIRNGLEQNKGDTI